MDNPYRSPVADCSFPAPELTSKTAPSALHVATYRGLLVLASILFLPIIYFAVIVFPGDWFSNHTLRQIIIVWIAMLSFGIAALATAVLAFAVSKGSQRIALIGAALFLFAVADYAVMFWIYK